MFYNLKLLVLGKKRNDETNTFLILYRFLYSYRVRIRFNMKSK